MVKALKQNNKIEQIKRKKNDRGDHSSMVAHARLTLRAFRLIHSCKWRHTKPKKVTNKINTIINKEADGLSFLNLML